MLVGAMNPCPCSSYGSLLRECQHYPIDAGTGQADH